MSHDVIRNQEVFLNHIVRDQKVLFQSGIGHHQDVQLTYVVMSSGWRIRVVDGYKAPGKFTTNSAFALLKAD